MAYGPPTPQQIAIQGAPDPGVGGTPPIVAAPAPQSPATTASGFPSGVDPSLAMQGQQPQPQGPPRPQPILQTLIQGLRNPQSTGAGSRSQVFEGFLGNFIGALGKGFANEGHGPGAAMRGAGAAIGAPYEQAVNQWQMGQQAQQQQAQIGQEQAQTAMTNAQRQQMGQMVNIPDGRGGFMSMPLSLAKTVAPAAFGAQAKTEAAGITSRFKVTPEGVFDTQPTDGTQPRLVPGSGPRIVNITQEIADDAAAHGVPEMQQFVGQTMPMTKYATMRSGLERGAAIAVAPVQGAEGPALVNKLTGKVTKLGLGSPGIASVLAKAGVTPYDTVDADGNPTTISARQAIQSGAPGIGRVNLMQAGGRRALIDDIHGGIDQLRESAGVLDNQGSKLRIAAALAEPGLTLQTAVQSPILGGMSPAEQDYTIRLMSLREQSLAMRSVLGAGQGSEDLRKAILQTVPSAATPNSKYALKQLDQFESVLNRVEKGVPQIKRPGAPAGATPSASTPPVQLPAQARTQLKEGETVTFKNGQTWTLQKGKPVQVQPAQGK